MTVRASRTGWRRPLAVVLALIVGVTLGVAGTIKERDAAVARDAASELSLAVVLSTLPQEPVESGQAEVGLRLLNHGPRPVTVEGIAIDYPGFEPGPVSEQSAVVAPGEWLEATASTGEADCAAAGSDARRDGAVRVLARLDSGELREARESVQAYGGFVPGDLLWLACPDEAGGLAHLNISIPAEIVDGPGGLAVVATVYAYDGPAQGVPLEQLTVSGNDFLGLEVLPDDNRSAVTSDDVAAAQFTVRDCPEIDDLPGAVLEFAVDTTSPTVRRETQPIQLFDTELIRLLVELIHRVCDEP